MVRAIAGARYSQSSDFENRHYPDCDATSAHDSPGGYRSGSGLQSLFPLDLHPDIEAAQERDRMSIPKVLGASWMPGDHLDEMLCKS